MISIRPGTANGIGNAIGDASAVIVAGTNLTAFALTGAEVAAISRRQVNTMLAFTSCRRATIDTEAPGANVSATIRRFSSPDQHRRRRRPSAITVRSPSSDANINDRVHYPFVDTIIVSHHDKPSPIFLTRPGGPRRRLTFNLARKWNVSGDGANPTVGLTVAPDVHRQRFLTQEEANRLLVAIDADEN